MIASISVAAVATASSLSLHRKDLMKPFSTLKLRENFHLLMSD
jgi:hypothetical protein